MALNRGGRSSEARADVAVRFAARVARERGHLADEDLRALSAAGYGPDQNIEIVLHLALNTLTNYINTVAKTEVDFPLVSASARAK